MRGRERERVLKHTHINANLARSQSCTHRPNDVHLDTNTIGKCSKAKGEHFNSGL